MRSHYDRTIFGESFHVFNPNTEGVTDEGHYLSVDHCPLCQEGEAEVAHVCEYLPTNNGFATLVCVDCGESYEAAQRY